MDTADFCSLAGLRRDPAVWKLIMFRKRHWGRERKHHCGSHTFYMYAKSSFILLERFQKPLLPYFTTQICCTSHLITSLPMSTCHFFNTILFCIISTVHDLPGGLYRNLHTSFTVSETRNIVTRILFSSWLENLFSQCNLPVFHLQWQLLKYISWLTTKGITCVNNNNENKAFMCDKNACKRHKEQAVVYHLLL